MELTKTKINLLRIIFILSMMVPFPSSNASASVYGEKISPENVTDLKLASWMGQGSYSGEIALQPDGPLLAAAASTGVALFDRSKPTKVGFIPIGLEPSALAISPDGDTLAAIINYPTGGTQSDDDIWAGLPEYRQEIHFFSLPNGQALSGTITNLLDCANSNIWSLAYTLDGDGLLFERKYGTRDNIKLLCYLDLATARVTRTMELPNDGELAISPAGNYAAHIQWTEKAKTARLQIFTATDFSTIKDITMNLANFPSILFANSGNAVSIQSYPSGEQNGPAFTVLSVPEGKTIYQGSFTDQDDSLMSLDVNPDLKMAVLGTQQGMVRIINLQTGKDLHTFGPVTYTSTSQVENPSGENSTELPVYIKEVAFVDQGKSVVASENLTTMGQSGSIHQYQLDDEIETARFIGAVHSSADAGMAFSPDSTRLAYGNNSNGAVDVYSIPDGKPVFSLYGHTALVNEVQYSPDGKLLASASDDATIRLWDADTWKLMRTLIGHQKRVTRIVFSPDGTRLVSGADDNTIRIWRVSDGSLEKTLELGDENWQVYFLNVLPDNNSLIYRIEKYPSPYIGYIHKQILWNIETGQGTTVGGNTISLTSITSDGSRFIGYANGIVFGSIQKDSTMQITQTFRSPYGNGALTNTTLSPDGNLVVSGNGFGLHAWKVIDGKLEFIGLCALGEPVPSYGSQHLFSPDGRYLAMNSGGVVYLMGLQD